MLSIKELYERLDICTDEHERVEILFDVATFFLNSNEQRVLEVAEEIKELAEKLNSDKGRCYYHSTKGRLCYRKSMYREASEEFQTALELSQLTPDLLMQAICYDSLGVALVPQNKHSEALGTSLKALALYEQMPGAKSLAQQVVCYNNIGVAYKAMNEWEKSVRAYQKGLELAMYEPDDRLHCILLTNLAEVHMQQGRLEEAHSCLLSAIDGFKKLNHKNGEIHATVSLAQCQLEMGHFALALQGYIAAVKLLKQFENKTAEINALKGIGNVYVAMAAYPEALKHYQKALQVAEATANHKELCDIYLCLIKTFHALELPLDAAKAIETGINIAMENHLYKELAELERQKEMMTATMPNKV